MAALVLVLLFAWTLAMSAQVGQAYERMVRRTMPTPHWTVTHSPAAATVATGTKAATAGAVHVADCVLASFLTGSTAAGAVSTITLDLRDSTTGAGNVLASWGFTLPVTANTMAQRVQICGVHIAGVQGQAMTLEFSAAGGTNTLETLILTGYDR